MKRYAQNSMYWVIAALVVSILPQLSNMPVQLVPITLLPIAWRVAAEIKGWKPFHTAIRILFITGVMIALFVNYGSLLGRRAAVSLLTIMLALKLLETFKVRDARIVASLTLFLCATQFLFSQGLGMLGYGAAVMLLSLVSLALLARQEAFLNSGKPPTIETGVAPELKYSAKLLAIALPLGIAMFLFFPRWSSPMWGVPEEALDAKSGLSSSMKPGSIQELFMDDSPAFRVDFKSEAPPQNALYWRGPVLWDFDGASWTADYLNLNVDSDRKPRATTAPFHYNVQLEPHEQSWMFALDYPAITPRGARLSMDYQLLSRRPVTQLKSYEMVSDPNFIDSPGLKNTIRISALALPEEFNPRTREMMEQWRDENENDADLVLRALKLFRSENFEYTLNPPLLTNHTVDEFLFDTQSGFCEHYASAFSVMMRFAGIPSRVVTGYQGGWYNSTGNYLLVRQSDAHAWSEVWLEGRGWQRVDPTAAIAPNRIDRSALDALSAKRHLLDFAWLRDVRNRFDLVSRRWNDWIIAFDAAAQSSLLSAFGIERLTTRDLVIILGVVITVIGFILGPLLLRLRANSTRDPAYKLWIKFMSRLEKAGVKTSYTLGPLELAELAGGQLVVQKDQIDKIADLYLRIRYAPNKPPLSELEKEVRAFRATPLRHQ